MSHGPVMLDLAGFGVTDEERHMLRHPAAGGVILFSRNYQSSEQLRTLTEEIHSLRTPSLLIAVDQEGGRVQRFRDGFTRLPPAAWYGRRFDRHPEQGRAAAHTLGWLMAAELRACGVDFSFAPVLDLANPISNVIGDRGFHVRPDVVTDLVRHWMAGAREGGMASVGKHFPGHGSVAADSHLELPVDNRRFEDLLMEDLIPFERLIGQGLEAVMPAHVIYEKIDPLPAGFSTFWLQKVLRQRFDFQGVIFSDDLSMSAAAFAGGYPERARAALNAGCDMVLVCNNQEAARQVLVELRDYQNPAAQSRLVRMHGRKSLIAQKLHLDPRWRKATMLAAEFEMENATLALDL
ncbi:MAG: beta-N-acetylhexosaminidase [Gammaproteobacteria bacterium]|nr:beta-N-acetylhexosaminidase [Gammaproteobacteria bacterium]MBU1653998.1 beta-N-acetylhexosaminidase [Gammaproteobacteria bacterium]MBU1960743.1 beta-N-acetylhexosaminidase [Gammaproteobacteria bacterium]